jgi:hypothetical protein
MQYDPRKMERWKKMAYKQELEREMQQRTKIRELDSLINEQGKYEANKQFMINNTNDNNRMSNY